MRLPVRRLFGAGLAAATIASGLTVVATPAAASPTSTPTPVRTDSESESGTRPDAASAAAAARLLGRPIEVTDATTETTRRWANPDGTFSDEVYAAPVRTRRGDDWVSIDTTLAARDGAVRPGATMGDVRFSAGGDRALASVSHDGARVALTWPKPLPAPTLDGNAATYAEVLPGVDLEMKAVPAGYEQSFVLKDRTAAKAALSVPLTAPGLTPTAKDGAIALRDARGTERAWIGAARMWDATGRTAPVGVAVTKTADGHVMKMTPDAKMLADPALQYPVTVDPTVVVYRSIDAYVDSGNAATNYGGNAYLKIGKRTSTYRSYIAFDLTPYNGKHVTNVNQYMGTVDSVTCSAKTTNVYRVSASWGSSSITWNAQPTTVTGTVVASATSAGGGPVGSTCESNAWMTFNSAALTDLYDDWANGRVANYGLGIRTASETDTQAAKDFASGENTSWTPRVHITYNSHPNTVAGRSVTPAQLGSDNSTRYAPTTTPTLSGGACDPEGSPVRVDFEIYDSTKTTLVASSPSTAPSVASCATAFWTVPSNTLTNGTTYHWRAKAFDGTDLSKNWSSWIPLVIDTTAPNTPYVFSSSYPENAWSDGGVSTVVDTGPNGSTDVIGYYHGVDIPEPTQLGYEAVIELPNDGTHTLYVRSLDQAGNKSAARQYTFYVGQGGVDLPRIGDRTEKSFTLKGVARGTWQTATWVWRRGPTDAWTDVTGLKDTNNNNIGPALTVPTGGGALPTAVWDVESALGADGAFELALRLEATGVTPVVTQPRRVSLDRTDFGSSTATENVGPGTVNLLTGNLAVSDTDVTFTAPTSDLTVSRTFNSRAPQAEANGPFGPGWVSSVPVETAESDYVSLAVSGSLVTVTMQGGDTVSFTKQDYAGAFTSEFGFEDLTLSYVSGSDRYDLKDMEGNVTGFTKPTGATHYVPTAVTQVGNTASTTYAYETVTVNGEAVTRVTGVMAPQPPGLTEPCTLANPSVTGCRSLKLTYSPGTTTPPVSGTYGDYPHRLKKVEAIAYDPDETVPGMRTRALAEYAYDSTGRLAQAWDPRLPLLKTTYAYNADGQLATITPPAEEAWSLTYAPLSGEAAGTGRLKTVSRPTLLSSPAPATATTTVVYRVPLTTANGGPYNLSAAELDRTGQLDRPTTATAIFPPTTAATFGSGSLPVPSSYDRATVHYLNPDGREVNTADPNGGITTTEHDARGLVVRTLTAANRQRALDQGATTEAEAAAAQLLSTQTVHSADGLDVLETFGPEHAVHLPGAADPVRGRSHTVNTYDEGMTGGPYHLVTTSVTSLRKTGEVSDTTTDSRTTKTQYGSTTTSWALGKPTATIVDAVTGGLNLTTRGTYAADGRVLTQTLPAGGTATNTAATRVTRYYSAGVDSTDAACGLKPEWVNLVCSVGPGGQPTGNALPTTYTTYDMFGKPRVTTEKTGATTLRTTTVTYDSAGRPWKQSITASTGTALPTVETVYDANGRATETRSLDALGAWTARVVRAYNSLGQLTSYTDTDGNVSTTTYDVAGRPAVTYDGKGTQTRTYDEGTERRGLLTSLADTHAGTWTATYDVAGTPTVDWPNSLRSTTSVNEVGSETALTHAATSGCTGGACTVFAETVEGSLHQQWLARSSTLSDQTYTYDAAGRLKEVADTYAASCTTRRYTFDAGGAGNGNRTKLETFNPATGGGCQTTTVSSTVTSTYDAADRITTSGAVYDTLGRTTTVPDANTLDTGALTVGYHVNDLVRSTAIAGGTTKTYTLDVDQQRVRSWTDGTTTRTHHYDGDSDNPAWTQESATAWTRAIGGISGDLAAIYDSATSSAKLQLTNLHGDVVATTPTTSVTPSSTQESTEYGVPRGATGTRYAWLGGKQRAADTPSGLIVMGVRLYNPATGRFLQVDPVYGGNANAYVYVLSPLTEVDLDGRRRCWRSWRCAFRGVRSFGRGVRHMYRHTEVSIGGCMGICYGLGFQGGTGYMQVGGGCCFAGGNIGYARKQYKHRNCQSYVGTGKIGPVGGYGSVGARRGRVDWSDWSGGYSYGAGAGGGYLRNIDLWGQRRYCR